MKAKERSKRRSRLITVISTHLKRRLEELSKAEDRSMSAILEDLLETNLPQDPDLKVGPGKGDAWVEANRGILKGAFTKKDYERDDLLGHILRKHAPLRSTCCWMPTSH